MGLIFWGFIFVDVLKFYFQLLFLLLLVLTFLLLLLCCLQLHTFAFAALLLALFFFFLLFLPLLTFFAVDLSYLPSLRLLPLPLLARAAFAPLSSSSSS